MTTKASRSRARIAFVALASLALLASIGPALRSVRAAGLSLAVVGADDPTRITHLSRHPVPARETAIALPGRTLRAHIYTPLARSGRPAPRSWAMVLHGVHPDSIDGPRLQAFARALAATGVETYTPG